MPLVSVIIVNYNSGDRLARCLDSLAAQTFANFETIVVDNQSADGSRDLAADHTLRVLLIDAGGNVGFAAANNLAARSATGEWLAFLNPDAYPQADWLAALLAASARHPDVDAFGSTQLDAADPTRLDGAGDVFHIFGVGYRGGFGHSASSLPAEGECFAPCAAAAMYRASVFRSLGGFDERFFCYGEDVDLGFRLRLTGGRAVQVPAAVVLHEGSGVTGRHSDFTIYHGHRNRFWLWWKNMPLPLLVVSAPLNLVLTIYLFARFLFAGGAAAYAKGVRDAIAGIAAFNEDRRALQRGRRASVGAIAAMIAWSPFLLLGRRPKIMTFKRRRTETAHKDHG
jgi:GT2 family glycosyltransferase